MARLVDIDVALDRYYAEWELQDICSGEEDRDWLMKCINEAPTIEAEHTKHGKWEEFDCEYGGIPTKGYVCSECGRTEANKEPYCNCGADMRGEHK